jgi:hypothetical protein
VGIDIWSLQGVFYVCGKFLEVFHPARVCELLSVGEASLGLSSGSPLRSFSLWKECRGVEVGGGVGFPFD